MRRVLTFKNAALTGYGIAWLNRATASNEQVDGLLGHGCHCRNLRRVALGYESERRLARTRERLLMQRLGTS